MRRALSAAGATIVGLIALLRFKTVPETVHRKIALFPDAAAAAGELSGTGHSNVRTIDIVHPATQPITVVVGPAVRIASGTVQVQVTMRGPAIVDVAPRQLPHAFQISRNISAAVAPAFQAEVLSSQGASIDMISGATLTSEAYEESLQAALDRARGLIAHKDR